MDKSSSLRIAMLLPSWGGGGRFTGFQSNFSLQPLFQQERDSFFLIIIPKPVLAETLETDGIFLKMQDPIYLPVPTQK